MKHMKKSMFITTLAMVVVLVVALSTATFAWYSASSQVTASTTDLMSASSSSAAIALAKEAVTSASTGTTVTFTTTVTTGPMVPTINPEVGTTTYAEFKASFKSAGIDTHNYFTEDGATAVPSFISTVAIDGGAATAAELFYVGNTNPGANPTIQMHSTIATSGNIYVLTAAEPANWNSSFTSYYTKSGSNYTAVTGENAPTWAESTYYKQVAIDSNLANCLRIAIFVDGKYAATYGNTARATNVGDATYMKQGAYAQYDADNHDITGYGISTQYNCVAQATETTIKACTGVQSATVAWLAWFDGCQLISDYAGYAAQFSFTFSVAQ